jgi:hypothetical protein
MGQTIWVGNERKETVVKDFAGEVQDKFDDHVLIDGK